MSPEIRSLTARLPSCVASLLAALLALFIHAGLHAPVARAATPRAFVGVVSEDAFGGAPAYRTSVLARVRRLGAGTMRQTLDWATVEPRRGVFDWSGYDGWVEATAAVGIRVLPVLFNPPDWASSRPAQGALRGTYPPRDNADFADFAAAAVRRYGPHGTFWDEHPRLPRLAIRSWQVWNEPSLPVYWQPHPRASQYVALLRATSLAVKAVDPGAQILTAGLPKSRLGIPLTTYIRQMYRAGGADAFDALATNPYARTAGGVLSFLRRIRGIMNSHGDRAATLWATEIGWSDSGPKGAFRAGASGQAARLRAVIPMLWRARRGLKLQGVIYFNWRDATPYPGGKDFWGLHTGLLRLDGSAKPAYAALKTAVAHLR